MSELKPLLTFNHGFALIGVQRTTVLVTLVGTDLATLPSECWFTRLARRIENNNIERGRGARKGHFRLGCEVSQLHLAWTAGPKMCTS